ncbi:hypothetical protein Y032_0120g948 [Ancylostoma ceylanicum]|uniref:Uncharacterized protein n=1 Tax=Ancylostoma ceylanicum TaxID=53326 RepID=A0A016TAV5_9BILA|nr:hypothetical protein Y032_0120g948 [Ancylostoma ceylanicum]
MKKKNVWKCIATSVVKRQTKCIQGIRSGVEVASDIRARAYPFHPCQKLLARSLSTKDLNGWNGSARARICDATSTPGRMPRTRAKFEEP